MECQHQSMAQSIHLPTSRKNVLRKSGHIPRFGILARFLSRLLHDICNWSPLHGFDSSHLQIICVALETKISPCPALLSKLPPRKLFRCPFRPSNLPGFLEILHGLELLRSFNNVPHLWPPNSCIKN